MSLTTETPEERRQRERQETLEVLWYRKWWIKDPSSLLDDPDASPIECPGDVCAPGADMAEAQRRAAVADKLGN